MKKILFSATMFAMFSLLLLLAFNCSGQKEDKPMTKEELIARGKYLVTVGGCGDCHSPKVFTNRGPMPDTTRSLAGFPQEETLPEINMKTVQSGMWVMTNNSLTGWVGPWGISYAANITPDKATGIGALSEEMFIKAFREGKVMGVGRPILPPMPWQTLGQMTDEDLKSIYAYLMTIPAVHNEVPQPVSPDKIGKM